MIEPLRLTDQTPHAQGRSRLVFQHPHEHDWLVKVMRPDVIEQRFGSGAAWYKRRRRFGRYLSYVREIQEFVACWSSHQCSLPFLQKVIGLIETDLGLGLVIRAVRGGDGKLAKPLSLMIRDGDFDDAAAVALDEFMNHLLACDVIISDLNPGNIVYAHDLKLGHYFVMIDGLGNSNIWPLKSLSRRINRRSKLGRFKRLKAKMDRHLRQAGHSNPIGS